MTEAYDIPHYLLLWLIAAIVIINLFDEENNPEAVTLLANYPSHVINENNALFYLLGLNVGQIEDPKSFGRLAGAACLTISAAPIL